MINDDASIVEIIRRVLEMAGHDVRTSVHGRDVLDLFDSFDPQLIITDIIPLDVDSIDTVMECCRRPATKIIVISGGGHLLNVAEKHGVDYVLTKPFGLRQINALVSTAFN